jgi:prolyl-tRNA synthetase
MGCYGIGVSRLLSAIIEEYSDIHGIIWPLNLAPFKVSLVLLKYNKTIKIICDMLYAKMLSIGMSVIYDDRDSGATEKLKDNYLIGVPLLVVIGSNFSKFKEIDLIKHRVLIKKIKISNINDISLGVTRYIKNLIV